MTERKTMLPREFLLEASEELLMEALFESNSGMKYYVEIMNGNSNETMRHCLKEHRRIARELQRMSESLAQLAGAAPDVRARELVQLELKLVFARKRNSKASSAQVKAKPADQKQARDKNESIVCRNPNLKGKPWTRRT